MGTSTTSPPRWLRCYATELDSGNLIDVAGEHYRIVQRTYTPAFDPTFKIQIPSGFWVTLMKNTKIAVFDPDGSVAARVHELPEETHP